MKHLQTDECVFTRYVYNSIGQPSLATGSRPCRSWFSTLQQLVFDLAAPGFQPCRHWFSTLPPLILDLTETGDFAAILVTSVMESIRHNCEELVQEFEKSVKQDGRINL